MSNHYKTNFEHQQNLFWMEDKLGQALKLVISIREKGEYTPNGVTRLYKLLSEIEDYFLDFKAVETEEETPKA